MRDRPGVIDLVCARARLAELDGERAALRKTIAALLSAAVRPVFAGRNTPAPGTGGPPNGRYQLLADETCWLVAIDLDGPTWRDDIRALRDAAADLDVRFCWRAPAQGVGRI